jgi:hypothetical protein
MSASGNICASIFLVVSMLFILLVHINGFVYQVCTAVKSICTCITLFHKLTRILCGFLKKSFWVGATANPPKSDDWKWATDKRCIQNKWLLKKSTFYVVGQKETRLKSHSVIKAAKFWWLPDDCLMTAWWLPDDCLMTAWWLPDGCLKTSWRLPDHNRAIYLFKLHSNSLTFVIDFTRNF